MSRPAIDAQFNRAVDIVQSLPKGGPVQTSYEEKLCLYSLYKQATEGDIRTSRPGMLDMLGRAKWDSWNKQKGTPKDEAKQRYVSALLKILRKHVGQPGILANIAEIEAYNTRNLPRAPSPASSTSSYHSSQASPPETASGSHRSMNQYLPPDPQSPIPDVAPDIIPPSALNSSHRSLLNLLQPSSHMTPESFSAPPSYLGPIPATRQGAASIRGSEGRKGSVSSVRYIRPGAATPSHLGSVHEPPRPSGSRSYSPLMPAVRDFGTPDMSSTPQPPIPHHLTPGFHGTASPSAYSHVPLGIPQTLQQIQVSLTALHERLSTLERTQAMLLRRDDGRRSWRIFNWKGEADELDEIEDETYRDRWGMSRTNTATSTQRKKPQSLTIRAIWVLMTAIRRAMVDLGVGVLLAMVVVVAVGGGWSRARRTLSRLFVRTRRFIQES
ncbi:acyl CoA binding protein-domain-containing protein [Papiliotrema laurentii]|uniref:Acyl CoA binding protein-domain-containing protein n=1 Tax=Papiliotrema laurentii TaxID=5418 RepID=A0AAD9FST4_PAPLA|nr:acyl CoA binding protein-domain-containing protein [Papiliotrema laurentii]